MNVTDQCVHIKNTQDFEKVLKDKERVVALFYAMWCPFCVRFLPAFEKGVANARGGKTRDVVFVMVEDVESLEDQYAVDVVPTVLYFAKGTLSKRLDGILGVGLNDRQLTQFLDTIE